MSAGIICYMMTDTGPQLILGREQHVKGWAGSLRWSEFGGNADGSDHECPKLTAAREFFEESLGVMGDLSDTLRDDGYKFHVVVRQTSKHGPRTKFFYIVELPYDSTVAQRFQGRREHLKNILYSVARLRDMQRALLRSKLPAPDYAFDIGGLKSMVRKVESIEKYDNGTFAVQFCTAGDARGLAADRRHTLKVTQAQAERYASLIGLKNWLDRLIAGFPEKLGKAAIVFKTRCGQKAWLPYVKKEFLEKDMVGTFDTKAIYENSCDIRVRRSFTMPLNLIAQQLVYMCSTNLL